MKILILTMLLFVSCNDNSQDKEFGEYTVNLKKNVNFGHRLGGDIIKGEGIRQNTLKILNIALKEKIYEHKKFKYWEFDVRETKDNVLIVHHDRSLAKKKEIYIDTLTYNEVLSIKPDVPLYEAVLSTLNEKFKGNVAVEIKSLISNTGRSKLIEEVERYRVQGNLKIKYLAFSKKFKKSFPKNHRKAWCRELVFVMKAGMHKKNLCK